MTHAVVLVRVREGRWLEGAVRLQRRARVCGRAVAVCGRAPRAAHSSGSSSREMNFLSSGPAGKGATWPANRERLCASVHTP